MDQTAIVVLLRRAVANKLLKSAQARNILRLVNGPSPPSSDGSLADAHSSRIKGLEQLLRPSVVASKASDRKSGELGRDALGEPMATDPVRLVGVPPHFHLQRLIGEGGMGMVYEAIDQRHLRRVAIKIGKSGPNDASFAEILRHECDMLAALKHPGIVTLFDSGELDGGHPFYVMEYVDGASLTDYAAKVNLNLNDKVRLIYRVAQAVGIAHSLHIVHRDLKPQNIMVTNNGSPKILDFGLAQRRSVKQRAGAAYESQIVRGGTAGYMSPEQALGHRAECSSDVYSLGVILHELVVGRLPFGRHVGDTMFATSKKLPAKEPSQLELPSHVPADLAQLLRKCLSPRPRQRYSDARALARELGRWLRGHPLLVVHRWRRAYVAKKFMGRHRRSLCAVSGATLAFLVLAAGAYHQNSQARNEAERLQADAQTNAVAARQAEENAESQRRLAQRRGDALESELHRQGITTAVQLVGEHRYLEAADALNTVPQSRRGWEFDRLAATIEQSPGPTRMLGLHDGPVSTGAVSPDGHYLATADVAGRVIAWDLREAANFEVVTSSQLSQVLFLACHLSGLSNARVDQPSPDRITGLAWLPDNRKLVATSRNGLLIEWAIGANCANWLFRHGHPLTAVAASPAGHLLAGDDQGRLVLFSNGKFIPIPTDSGTSEITKIVSLPTNQWLVAYADGTLRWFDHQLAVTAQAQEPSPIWDMAATRDGCTVWVACGQPALVRYSLIPPNHHWQRTTLVPFPVSLKNRAAAIHAVAVSDDGQWLIAGDDRGVIAGWSGPNLIQHFVRTDQDRKPTSAAELGETNRAFQRRVGFLHVHHREARLVTAGRDGVVNSWDLTPWSGLTNLHVGSHPSVAFDTAHERWLWVGTADGQLRLWDSASAVKIAEIQAHESSIQHLVYAAKAQITITTDGQCVRFWKLQERAIEPATTEIRLADRIVGLAVTSDGRRLAIVTANGRVSLRDLLSGVELVQASLGSNFVLGENVLTAFDHSASRLAVGGPAGSIVILDGGNLNQLELPYMFVHRGTALAWSTGRPGVLYGGDDVGRVHAHPEPKQYFSYQPLLNNAPVAGLAFTPDASRLAVASLHGDVVISEPQHLGPVLTLSMPHVGEQNANVSGLSFDPAGRRLAVVHTDGAIRIWETGPFDPSPELSPRRWIQAELLGGSSARGLAFRSPSVACDESGRLAILFGRSTEDLLASENRTAREVVLGRETPNGFQTSLVASVAPLDDRGYHSLERSLALARDHAHWLAAFRLPRLEKGPTIGELMLARIPQASLPLSYDIRSPPTAPAVSTPHASSWKTESITMAGGNGFDCYLLHPLTNGYPDVLHFAHAGNLLLLSRRVGNGWTTRQLGRHGDGLQAVACTGLDGRTHLAFAPTRFNGDPQPAIYLCLSPDHLTVERREIIDPEIDLEPYGIGVTPAGEPVVFASQPPIAGRKREIICQRDSSGWQRSWTFPPLGAVNSSNLLYDGAGRFYFVRVDLRQRVLSLFIFHNDKWWHERVASVALPDAEEAVNFCQPVIVLDPASLPVIVWGYSGPRSGRLCVWRPEH